MDEFNRGGGLFGDIPEVLEEETDKADEKEGQKRTRRRTGEEEEEEDQARKKRKKGGEGEGVDPPVVMVTSPAGGITEVKVSRARVLGPPYFWEVTQTCRFLKKYRY